MSSGAALAYFHEHVQVAISSKTPVSSSSYSVSCGRGAVRLDQVGVWEPPCGYLYSYFRYEWVGVLSR